MTREEEIKQAAQRATNYGSSCNNYAYLNFIEGAEWADANPARPWIRTREQLPMATKFKDRYMHITQSRDVLIDLPGGAITIARLICQDGKPTQWECFNYTYPLGLVLHWQELPDYPKYSDEQRKGDHP